MVAESPVVARSGGKVMPIWITLQIHPARLPCAVEGIAIDLHVWEGLTIEHTWFDNDSGGLVHLMCLDNRSLGFK